MATEHCAPPAATVPGERLRILVVASGGVIQEVYCSEGDADVYVLDMDELGADDQRYDCWIPENPATIAEFRRDCAAEIGEHEEVAQLADAVDPAARSLVGASWGHFGPKGCP